VTPVCHVTPVKSDAVFKNICQALSSFFITCQWWPTVLSNVPDISTRCFNFRFVRFRRVLLLIYPLTCAICVCSCASCVARGQPPRRRFSPLNRRSHWRSIFARRFASPAPLPDSRLPRELVAWSWCTTSCKLGVHACNPVYIYDSLCVPPSGMN